jgi:hypothetical protein
VSARRRQAPADRRGRRGGLVVSLAVALAAAGASALLGSAGVAAADVPIAFSDQHALKLRWQRLEAGVPVEVCNTQPAPARDDGASSGTQAPTTTTTTTEAAPTTVDVSAEVRGFDFEINGESVRDQDVVHISPASLSLAPGKCGDLSLSAGSSPDAGEYSGLLLLRVSLKDGTTFVRRDLTVVAPKANATRPAAAVDEVNLHATRNFLTDDSIGFADEATLPLDAAPRPRLQVPEPGTLIGVLQSGTARASVYVAGKLKNDEGRRALPIRLDGPGVVGTYSGSVDLATGEGDPLPVKLKVDTSDSTWWAIAAIALGLLIAGIALWLRDHTVPKSQLQGRRDDLLDRYRRKRSKFAADFANRVFKKYEIDEPNIKAYQEKVRQSIERYSDDHLLFDRSGDDFKKLVRMLQDAEADADLIGDGFGQALDRLEAIVVEFRAEHPDSVPAFVERAAARLAGGKLPVGGAAELVKEVEAYLKLTDDWKEMAKTVKRLEGWVELLEQAGLDAPARAQLERAQLRIREARLELLHATDAKGLEAAGTARDLARAYDELVALGARYGVWEPPEEESQARDLNVRTQRFHVRAPDELGELIEGGRAPELVGLAIEVLGKVGRGFAEVGIVALAILTAIFVALPTVVSDNTFGTWRDYLAALGLGGTAVVAAKAIFDLVGQMIERARV